MTRIDVWGLRPTRLMTFVQQNSTYKVQTTVKNTRQYSLALHTFMLSPSHTLRTHGPRILSSLRHIFRHLSKSYSLFCHRSVQRLILIGLKGFFFARSLPTNMAHNQGHNVSIEDPDISHIRHSDYDHVYEPSEDTFLLMSTLDSNFESLAGKKPKVCLEIGYPFCERNAIISICTIDSYHFAFTLRP